MWTFAFLYKLDVSYSSQRTFSKSDKKKTVTDYEKNWSFKKFNKGAGNKIKKFLTVKSYKATAN